jgi:hypothetical protein
VSSALLSVLLVCNRRILRHGGKFNSCFLLILSTKLNFLLFLFSLSESSFILVKICFRKTFFYVVASKNCKLSPFPFFIVL